MSPEGLERSNRSRATQLVHGRGGVIVVMYELSSLDWIPQTYLACEREQGLQYFRSPRLRYWSGTPAQHRQTNRLYRQMRIRAAHPELSRSRADIFSLTPVYGLAPRTLWLRLFSCSACRAGAEARHFFLSCFVLRRMGKSTAWAHHTSAHRPGPK